MSKETVKSKDTTQSKDAPSKVKERSFTRKMISGIGLIGIGFGGAVLVEKAQNPTIEAEIRSDVRDAADMCAELAVASVISGESITVSADDEGMTRLTETQTTLTEEYDNCINGSVNSVVEQTLEDYPAPEVSGRLVLEANQGE